jgi:chemotaxis protein MotB
MGRFMLFFSSCFCLVSLFSGCVHTSGPGDDGGAAQPQAVVISDQDRKTDELARDLDEARSDANQCREDLERLDDKFETINAEVQLNRRQIDALNQAIEKQATVISLQNSIIRLFDDSQQTLQNKLQEQIEAGDLDTGGSSQSIKYVLSNHLLFQTNSVELSTEGKALLTKLSGVLIKESYPNIRVLGHTDDRPLKSSARFADNWDLSAARALTVVRFLHEKLGVLPERLSAVGCGQFLPVADNNTADGRSLNRRIEIILEAGTPPAATVEIPDLQ